MEVREETTTSKQSLHGKKKNTLDTIKQIQNQKQTTKANLCVVENSAISTGHSSFL